MNHACVVAGKSLRNVAVAMAGMIERTYFYRGRCFTDNPNVWLFNIINVET
jgi:hypothetical protein